MDISSKGEAENKSPVAEGPPGHVMEWLQTAYAIVSTNSRSLSSETGLAGSAVYSLYSLINHTCLPNTTTRIIKVIIVRN